jgi:hypothetical protein
MASDGIDVRRYNPRLLNAAHLARASRIVSFGCDVGHVSTGGASVERWDDLPLVSDGYATARDAIVARVERLLDEV